MLECANRDPEFLKTVITGDESWLYGCDPETKVQGFLAKHGILQVRQAPHSPDIPPCDFWLFPRLKTPLKGSRFDNRLDIIQNAMAQLHAIPKEAFQNCFQRWKDHWAKCVWSHKGPTLKGIGYCNHPDTELCFPCPRVFYLASVRVYMVQQPEVVYVHSDAEEFGGHYWTVLQTLSFPNTSLVLSYRPRPTHVFGQPLSSIYHASDVARIQVLMECGGIYIDADTLVLRSLNRFRHFEMAVGWPWGEYMGTQLSSGSSELTGPEESVNDGTVLTSDLQEAVAEMCEKGSSGPTIADIRNWVAGGEEENLQIMTDEEVLVAHKDARFLPLWLNSYRHYHPRDWYYNAGQEPTQQILDKAPYLVHRVPGLFGVHNLAARLYGPNPWPQWRLMFTVHLLSRHPPAPQQLDEKSVIHYRAPFGDIGLAFRGHDESVASVNRGNYIEVLNMLARYDSDLHNHLESSTAFRGSSPDIQNELIHSISELTTMEIKKEISKANYVSLILDETSDVMNKCQLASVLRYVTADGNVEERFLRFTDVSSDRSANSLFNHALEILNDFECGPKLIAQTYDGAAVMASQHAGVQAKIRA
ncbi:hypothetical protein B7P43_G12310 [Cryptotermes secundus]|uniref:DUF4371 domain-containing protein n=2 Tax=Cryptotermes secundus TaxID=105785 RepID=A0A2J7RL30_9NEOP|nr:hypothetical protein B7P43_G12310 [Cryptotermes secundus]